MARPPIFLRIPMRFESDISRLLKARDYRGVYSLYTGFNLNDGRGPGYHGYIIYTLYQVNVQVYRFNILMDRLNKFSREYVNKRLIKNIGLLRRTLLHMLSPMELKFMKRYGLDGEWLRIKIIARSPRLKIENYYYKVRLGDLMDGIESSIKNGEVDKLVGCLREAIRVGIEVSLLLAWHLLLLTYIHLTLNTIMDEDDLLDVYHDGEYVDGVAKLMEQFSGFPGVNMSIMMKYYPHRLHTHSINSYGRRRSRGRIVEWMAIVEGCWVNILAKYVSRMGGMDSIGGSILCKLCNIEFEVVARITGDESINIEIKSSLDGDRCTITINASIGMEEDEFEEYQG